MIPGLGLALLAPVPLHAKERLERGERLALVAAESLTPQARLTLDDLASYLQRSLDAVVRRYPAGTPLEQIPESVCLLFGTKKDNATLESLAQAGTIRMERLGDEGGLVKAVAARDKLVVVLGGETIRGACHATYSFLENEVGVGFFIDGDRIPRPAAVDLRRLDRTEVPAVPIRGLFYHYIWKHPHANNWRLWSWEGWKGALNWMRRKRFNVIPIFHDEGGYLWGDIIFKTFPEIKKNDKSLAQFVVDPTWRTELNHKIFRYARDSGIQIAYNLFYSQVPEFFADYHPELKYHALNMRNLGISAEQPQCKEIMRRYWRAILDTHGIDDSHLYLVCSYAHEKSLPAYYESHNIPTLQAIEVLKELDPKARIFIETWCWKYRHEREQDKTLAMLTDNTLAEWRVFDAGIPRDIGVVEWDVKRNHEGLPGNFSGRPYIQLTHTNMEGWWPPQTSRVHPRWMSNYFGDAIQHGAQGVMFFHIQAGNNDIVADLASQVGWLGRPDVKKFYRDYARRRFGPDVADVMAESLEHFCDAVDFGPGAGSKYGLSLALVFPGVFRSAESLLADCKETGAERLKWLSDRLGVIEPKAAVAARAMLLARSVASRMKSEPFYDRYMFELDYVAARFDGIINLYRAHLVAAEDPAQAEQRFRRVMLAFASVKELFRDLPGHHMSALRKLEPTVPYTDAFLKDWETRGFWEPRSRWFHVVWERMDEFEEIVRGLRPKGIPAEK